MANFVWRSLMHNDAYSCGTAQMRQTGEAFTQGIWKWCEMLGPCYGKDWQKILTEYITSSFTRLSKAYVTSFDMAQPSVATRIANL